MNELMLVEEVNGQEVVSSKVIAENTGKEHTSIVKTIKNEMQSLKEFGLVGIQLRATEGNREEKIYYLNEDQATYLITCMRNNDSVRKFKMNLVKAFSSLKKQHIQETVSNTIGIKEEFEILQMTASFLNMNDSSKLEMTTKFYEIKGLDAKLLPNYSDSKGILLSLSELLKRNEIGLSAVAVNKLLVLEGLLEVRERPSTKGSKKFKALSEKGLEYGENLVSPQNKKEVAPQYYEDKFLGLMSKIGVM